MVPKKRLIFWACIALAAIAFGVGHRTSSHWPKLSLRSAKGDVAAPITSRKVYRYSVVPGGVYSVAEFEQARRVDPVVAAHYAGFGPKLSATKLTRDMFVYVSYRKANRVYWSTKKHKVCEGETVITDGKNIARGRCGNLLSYEPHRPLLDIQEPHEKDLNTEEPLIAKLPEGPLFAPGYPGVVTPDQYPGGSPGAIAPGVYPAATPARSGANNPFAAPANFLGALSPVAGGAPFFAAPATPGSSGNGDTGTTSPPLAGVVAPVPEPGDALLLLAVTAMAAWAGSRRKRLLHKNQAISKQLSA